MPPVRATDRQTGVENGAVDVDAVVVGAGFSGLYMLHRLRERGLSVRVLEKAEDVGGTWYWNRYPGARCDSESHIYCYSFSDELLEEWEWSERYPEQPEILEYLRFAADRLDLRRNVEFETEVTSAVFDEDADAWEVTTAGGESVTSRFFITAVGCLSKPFRPDFDGLDDFEGEQYHTARWPHDGVDLEGKDVGVIGTGSTGIQLIPRVAEQADHLTVFQRTPNYAVPARNRPLDDDEFEEIRENYDEIWERAEESRLGMPFEVEEDTARGLDDDEIEALLEKRWEQGGFRFLHTFQPGHVFTNPETNETISEFLREKIRGKINDPELAEKLVPSDHPYGAKRPPMDYEDYYGTFERDDVRLVDVDSSPITEFTSDGARTAAESFDLDVVIFATGFDAMTGAIMAMDVRGRNGITIEEKWADGPKTYLGLGVHGFPNLFTITGPQSPSVLTNMPVAIEQHVEWIDECIGYMDDHGHRLVEPTADAEAQWVSRTNMVAESLLFSEVESWYRGDNVPGKPSIFEPFPGGLETYRLVCEHVVDEDYEGFEFSGALEAATPGR